VLGKFWGALIVGLVGSFLGGLVAQLFKGVIKYLAEFNNGTVNVFAAAGISMFMLWLLSKASYPR